MDCIKRTVIMMPNSTQPPEKGSSLQTIAIVCTKLEQGVSEEEIRKFIDRDNEYASDFLKFYIEFALENSWLIKDESGKYKITKYGNEFISVFLPTDST
jgi:predicted transcriptional regulator